MAKLHELLAAEASVAGAHQTIHQETLKVFDKPEHFTRSVTRVSYFSEGDGHLNTAETKANTTTVSDRLSWSFGRSFSSYIDLLAQKDRTNQEARADVVVNGKVLLKDVPGTALLMLESKLADKRKELAAIPTLQPGPVWEWDESYGMYGVPEPKVTFRTKKTIRPIVLHPPTPEHPAQVQAINEDVNVAKIEQTVWSSMWTSAQKSSALERLDALLVAIKKARQRANRTDVVKLRIGETIANFVLNGPDTLTGSDEAIES